MKKVLACVVIAIFMLSSLPVFAAEKGSKGASAQACERASDQSVFNRVGDWFATIGKSDEEKAAILIERKAKRAAEKAEKKAQKAKKKIEKKHKGSKKGS